MYKRDAALIAEAYNDVLLNELNFRKGLRNMAAAGALGAATLGGIGAEIGDKPDTREYKSSMQGHEVYTTKGDISDSEGQYIKAVTHIIETSLNDVASSLLVEVINSKGEDSGERVLVIGISGSVVASSQSEADMIVVNKLKNIFETKNIETKGLKNMITGKSLGKGGRGLQASWPIYDSTGQEIEFKFVVEIVIP